MFSPYLTLPLPYTPTSLAFDSASGSLAYENQSLAEVAFKSVHDNVDNKIPKIDKYAPAFCRQALSWNGNYLAILEAAGKRLTVWDVRKMQKVFQYVASPQIIRSFSVDAGRRLILLVLGNIASPPASPETGYLANAMFFSLDRPDNPWLWHEEDLSVMTGCLVPGEKMTIHLLAHRDKGRGRREVVHLSGEHFDNLMASTVDVIDAAQIPGIVHLAVSPEDFAIFYGESLQGRLLYQYRDGFWIGDTTLDNERVLGLTPFEGSIAGLLEKDEDKSGFTIRDMISGKTLHHSPSGLPACLAASGDDLVVGADDWAIFLRRNA